MVTLRRAGVVSAGLAVLGVFLLSCQPPSAQGVQAPSPEQHPPPQTSNGQVVGADNKPAEQTLAEQGTTDHLSPGWTVDKNGVKYDPKHPPAAPEPGATRLEHPDGGTEILPQGN